LSIAIAMGAVPSIESGRSVAVRHSVAVDQSQLQAKGL
jgi:hypothetical protein